MQLSTKRRTDSEKHQLYFSCRLLLESKQHESLKPAMKSKCVVFASQSCGLCPSRGCKLRVNHTVHDLIANVARHLNLGNRSEQIIHGTRYNCRIYFVIQPVIQPGPFIVILWNSRKRFLRTINHNLLNGSELECQVRRKCVRMLNYNCSILQNSLFEC